VSVACGLVVCKSLIYDMRAATNNSCSMDTYLETLYVTRGALVAATALHSVLHVYLLIVRQTRTLWRSANILDILISVCAPQMRAYGQYTIAETI
jgi:hypothetical protein